MKNNTLPFKEDYFLHNSSAYNFSIENSQNDTLQPQVTQLKSTATLHSPYYYYKEHLFVVYVLTYLSKTEIFRCTGSLIKPYWVLTSAYCFIHHQVWPRNLMVIKTESALTFYLSYRIVVPFDENWEAARVQERRVDYYRVHPDFDKSRSLHDVALLKLKKPFSGELSYGIISLSKFEKVRSNCTIVGYGLIYMSTSQLDGRLRFVSNLTVTSPANGCHHLKKNAPFLCFSIKKNNVCKGDFGTPLLCDGEIWGMSTKMHDKNFFTLLDHRCLLRKEYYYTSFYKDLKWIGTTVSKSDSSLIIYKKENLLEFLALLLVLCYL